MAKIQWPKNIETGKPVRNLNDFIRSDVFCTWNESNQSSMGYEDPERAERCYEASEYGGEGSTHAEIISDWRQALQSSDIQGPIYNIIEKEIDDCETWHEENGSLHTMLG